MPLEIIGNVVSTGLPPEVSRPEVKRLILGSGLGAGCGGRTIVDGVEEGQR